MNLEYGKGLPQAESEPDCREHAQRAERRGEKLVRATTELKQLKATDYLRHRNGGCAGKVPEL